MPHIAIVSYSTYGHTAKQAEAVVNGARGVADTTVAHHILDKEGNLSKEAWDDLNRADAIIYGTPTYMGGPAWQFKKFAETSAAQWSKLEWKDKVGAGFTNSASVNGDKYSTIQYMWTLAQQHGQIWVGTGLKASNAKANGPDDVNWTASFGGAMAISPADSSPEEAPRKGDLETARLLGERVATITARLTRG